MAFDAVMPDGIVIENIPDGTPKSVIRDKWIAVLQHTYSPTEGQPWMDNAWAGMGKAFVDTARGAGQVVAGIADAVAPREQTLSRLVAGNPSRVDDARAAVADSRNLDAALMQTRSGKVGNFFGNVAVVAPTAFIPGANTVAGAGVIGAGLGMLQPSINSRETATNVVTGGAAGAGGQFIGQKLAQAGTTLAANRTAAAAEKEAGNAVRDATFREARAVGYKLPPATINQESTIARASNSISGVAATQQVAAFKNQSVTNNLIRADLGMPKNAELSRATLGQVRQQAGKVYDAVAKSGKIIPDNQFLTDVAELGNVIDDVAKEFPGAAAPSGDAIKTLADSLFQSEFTAAGALKYTRALRNQAKSNFRSVISSEGNVDKLALARAQMEAAGALEDMILRHLESTGQGALAKSFNTARITIAKAHDAELALNPGTGNIVATKLGAMLRRGKPLGGNFSLVARFAAAAPQSAGEQLTGPGVSALAAMLSGTAGTGGIVGGLLSGNPAIVGAGLAAASVPAGRQAVRAAILSKAGQTLAEPSYAPALLGPRALTAAGTALDPVLLSYLRTNAAQQ